MRADKPGEAGRKIGIPLIAGIYMAPTVFGWLLLRRGYANSTRMAVFIYALVTIAIGVVHVTMGTG